MALRTPTDFVDLAAKSRSWPPGHRDRVLRVPISYGSKKKLVRSIYIPSSRVESRLGLQRSLLTVTSARSAAFLFAPLRGMGAALSTSMWCERRAGYEMLWD
jgi:glycine cleavage system H lipoate-binding protein